jgi:hypothetical protein
MTSGKTEFECFKHYDGWKDSSESFSNGYSIPAHQSVTDGCGSGDETDSSGDSRGGSGSPRSRTSYGKLERRSYKIRKLRREIRKLKGMMEVLRVVIEEKSIGLASNPPLVRAVAPSPPTLLKSRSSSGAAPARVVGGLVSTGDMKPRVSQAAARAPDSPSDDLGRYARVISESTYCVKDDVDPAVHLQCVRVSTGVAALYGGFLVCLTRACAGRVTKGSLVAAVACAAVTGYCYYQYKAMEWGWW